MTVAELVRLLQALDPNAEVGVHSNSEDRDIDYVSGASLVYDNVVIIDTVDPDE